MAFQLDGRARRVRVNDWKQTTGKHLNAIDGGNKAARIPGEQFELELAEACKVLETA